MIGERDLCPNRDQAATISDSIQETNGEFDYGNVRAPRVRQAINGILAASPEALFDPRSLLDENSGVEDKKMLFKQINSCRGTFARNGYELHQVKEEFGTTRPGRPHPPRVLGYFAERVGTPLATYKPPKREEPPRRAYRTVDDIFTFADGTVVEGYRARTLHVLSGTTFETQLTIDELIERVLQDGEFANPRWTMTDLVRSAAELTAIHGGRRLIKTLHKLPQQSRSTKLTVYMMDEVESTWFTREEEQMKLEEAATQAASSFVQALSQDEPLSELEEQFVDVVAIEQGQSETSSLPGEYVLYRSKILKSLKEEREVAHLLTFSAQNAGYIASFMQRHPEFLASHEILPFSETVAERLYDSLPALDRSDRAPLETLRLEAFTHVLELLTAEVDITSKLEPDVQLLVAHLRKIGVSKLKILIAQALEEKIEYYRTHGGNLGPKSRG